MQATQTAASSTRRRAPRAARSPDQAPISATLRAQLQKDTSSIQALKDAAKRHGDGGLDNYDASIEFDAARRHFELGCWLAYYATRVYKPEALQDRIDCAARLLRAGIDDVGYQFYTAFRFGERNFDTCFEMGDADDVVAGLYERAKLDNELAAGLAKSGIKPRH